MANKNTRLVIIGTVVLIIVAAWPAIQFMIAMAQLALNGTNFSGIGRFY